MNRALLLFALVFLTACTFRGNLARIPDGATTSILRPVYFATNRGFDHLPFGGDRRTGLIFGEAVVSIPAAHEAGKIEWPRGTPDPEKHFLLAGTDVYDTDRSFLRKINAELAKRPRGEREVSLFIHGFNSRFADGLYRMAQIGHDLDLPGIAVQYSWPSAGHPLGYVYDRDSALFARDDLERLITLLSRSNAENVIVVAHSLGSLVTMEALRQMRLRGKSLSGIDGVVLMSPDIDQQLFKTQVEKIGTLPQPFVVFTSENDRALGLAERITGQRGRVGRLSDVSELSEYDITFIDVTAFRDGDPLNHFAIANSPALLQILGRVQDFDTAFSRDRSTRAGLLPGTVITVQNATRIILQPITGSGSPAAGP